MSSVNLVSDRPNEGTQEVARRLHIRLCLGPLKVIYVNMNGIVSMPPHPKEGCCHTVHPLPRFKPIHAFYAARPASPARLLP